MTNARQKLGMLGEELAVRELTARGYAILERRYRTRRGEIDIVCDHCGTIVFVEVRARATATCGRAAESITTAKSRRVAAMALDYLARRRLTDRPCRFDVVAIDRARDHRPDIRVYVSAFDAVR